MQTTTSSNNHRGGGKMTGGPAANAPVDQGFNVNSTADEVTPGGYHGHIQRTKVSIKAAKGDDPAHPQIIVDHVIDSAFDDDNGQWVGATVTKFIDVRVDSHPRSKYGKFDLKNLATALGDLELLNLLPNRINVETAKEDFREFADALVGRELDFWATERQGEDRVFRDVSHREPRDGAGSPSQEMQAAEEAPPPRRGAAQTPKGQGKKPAASKGRR